MAKQHSHEGIQEQRSVGKALKRRGLIAGAAALVAGIAAKQTSQPVAATFATMEFATSPDSLVQMFAHGASYIIGNSPFTQVAAVFVGIANQGSANCGIQGAIGPQTASSLPCGVYGQANIAGAAGVFGSAVGGTGVRGNGGGAGGIGVQGIIENGTTSSGTIGVYGANLALAQDSHGIVGLAQTGHGLVGTCNAHPNGTARYAGLVGLAGVSDANAGNFYGDVSITGTLNGHTAIVQHANLAVAHPDGTHRLAYSVASTESWLEDYGKGTLANGQAAIKVAPEFAAVADMSDYHVFLTAHGDYHLSAAEMKADGFVARATSVSVGIQPPNGEPVAGSTIARATGTFSWKVVARRKDVQAQRLAKYSLPHVVPPHIPAPPPALPAASATGQGLGTVTP